MKGCLSEFGRFILFLIASFIFSAITKQPYSLIASIIAYPIVRIVGKLLWGDKENNKDKENNN